ncbi:GOLPH3/VPS74 family protein [Streptomyces pilosus]|uniref:GOLPH3/VPS74 family protein n=1 Tax=Streptomyces pilosus TaxID=28893 RepID=UPI0036FA2BDF
MTTARDLSILAAAPDATPVPEQGDLSLALAGAELIDLVALRAVTLDDDRIVPGAPPETGDPLLREAASLLVREEPGETVRDWLWRRGRHLAARYRTALEAEGVLTPARTRRNPFRRARTAPADPPPRHRAAGETAAGPVLAGLLSATGVADAHTTSYAGLTDEQSTVLAGVHGAVTELAGERQRRASEQAAFDNVWRGE